MKQFNVSVLLLAAVMASSDALAAPPVVPSRTPIGSGTVGMTNSAPQVVFSTKRLADNSALLETIRGLFHGTVRLLPNDRVELSYDFSQPAQLEDFTAQSGSTSLKPAESPWQIRDGFLQKIRPDDVPLLHQARFSGPVTVSFKGGMMNGDQCALGYLDAKSGGQIVAGVKDQPLAAFLAQDGKVTVAGPEVPANSKIQQWLVNFTDLNYSMLAFGRQAVVAQRTDKASGCGRLFLAAPESTVAVSGLQIAGKLDLEWFRQAIDSQMTVSHTKEVSAAPVHFGPPPATEAQLRQLIQGFHRLLPDGRVELRYDFSNPTQFTDWQLLNPQGRPDLHAWRVYAGTANKCQPGSTLLMLASPLAGPIKVSVRAAILSGNEAGIGLRNSTSAARCGFSASDSAFFLNQERKKDEGSSLGKVIPNQYHAVELTLDGESKLTARMDESRVLSDTLGQQEPLNLVLSADNGTAMFDDLVVVGFLDRDWCVKQMRQHGLQPIASR